MLGYLQKIQSWLANSFVILDKLFSSKLFRRLIIGLFVLQASYFAVTIKFGIPPDEGWHIGIIEYYKHHSLDPFITDQTSGFVLGDITRFSGYLYHYLMSLVARPLGFMGDYAYFVLRLINVVIAAASVYVLGKVGDEIKLPTKLTNFGLFILTNSMMFIFMAGAITYDNIQVFVASLCFLYLVRLLGKVNYLNTLSLVLWLLVGLMIKKSFFPLAFLIGFAALVCVSMYIAKTKPNLKQMLAKEFAQSKKMFIVLGILTLIFSGLFVERHVVNYAIYRSVDVICDRVHSKKNCTEYPIYKRNTALANEAEKTTTKIRKTVFAKAWLIEMRNSIYRVSAHKVMFLSSYFTAAVIIFYIGCGLAYIRAFDFVKKESKLIIITSVAVAYGLVLMWVNYNTYNKYGVFGLALQGRYVFPVLGILLISSGYYLHKAIPEKLKLMWAPIALVTYMVFMLFGGALYFSAKANFGGIDGWGQFLQPTYRMYFDTRILEIKHGE